MAFSDSHMFEITDDGHALHKRYGDTYADKTLHGVDLDDTMWWGYEIDEIQNTPSDSSGGVITVGERSSNNAVIEVSKKWGKEKGEGKYRRQRSVPKAKKKKYPTKPKPKHSWHKRLSKVARELGDIREHTEYLSQMEVQSYWDDKQQQEEEKEEEQHQQYLYEWCEFLENNPDKVFITEIDSEFGKDLIFNYWDETCGLLKIKIGDFVRCGHRNIWICPFWSYSPRERLILPGPCSVPITDGMVGRWIEVMLANNSLTQ